MVRGTTFFKCNECGKRFIGMDIEWMASAYSAPVCCPKCNSWHTYPIGPLNLFGVIGPLPIYKKIWERRDKEQNQTI